MAEYVYTYVDDDTAEQLLEAFRLYGTKKGKYTARYLSLFFVLTDTDHSFYLTQAADYIAPGLTKQDDLDIAEYALVCGNAVSLIRCELIPFYKQIEIEHEPQKLHYYELYEIQEIFGENILEQSKIEEIISFYEANGRGKYKAFDYRNMLKEKYPGRNLDWWNITRQRELMFRKRMEWEACNELLVKDYSFCVTDTDCRERLAECIEKYGSNDIGSSNKYLDSAMTDGQNRFWLTLCYYLSEGIKRCGEPDDYEYAIVTNETMGVVHVWHPESNVQIKCIRGDIPLAEKELCDAINYYDMFRYYWASNRE